jgi:hypothetical protein
VTGSKSLVRRALDDDGPRGQNDPTDTFSWENGQIVFQFDGSASAEPAHRYLFNPSPSTRFSPTKTP